MLKMTYRDEESGRDGPVPEKRIDALKAGCQPIIEGQSNHVSNVSVPLPYPQILFQGNYSPRASQSINVPLENGQGQRLADAPTVAGIYVFNDAMVKKDHFS